MNSTYVLVAPSGTLNLPKGMSSALDNGQSTMKPGQTSGLNHRSNHFSNSSKA